MFWIFKKKKEVLPPVLEEKTNTVNTVFDPSDCFLRAATLAAHNLPVPKTLSPAEYENFFTKLINHVLSNTKPDDEVWLSQGNILASSEEWFIFTEAMISSYKNYGNLIKYSSKDRLYLVISKTALREYLTSLIKPKPINVESTTPYRD